MARDSHHRHAYLKAASRDTDGEFKGTLKLELRHWPDPEEALRLLRCLAGANADRVLTWWVKPPAKKYQPKPDNGQTALF